MIDDFCDVLDGFIHPTPEHRIAPKFANVPACQWGGFLQQYAAGCLCVAFCAKTKGRPQSASSCLDHASQKEIRRFPCSAGISLPLLIASAENLTSIHDRNPSLFVGRMAAGQFTPLTSRLCIRATTRAHRARNRLHLQVSRNLLPKPVFKSSLMIVL